MKVFTKDNIRQEINFLFVTKVIEVTNLPIKNLNENKAFFSDYIAKFFYDSLLNRKFPSCLKLVNITTVFKKGSRAFKNNYMSVSI